MSQDEISTLPPHLQDLVNREVERRLREIQNEVEIPALDDLPILQQIGGAPREVPLGLRLYLRLCSVSAHTLGWFFAMFGFTFAIIAVVVGVDDAIPRNWVDAGKGTITNVEDANFTYNDCKVYAYHFETTDHEAQKISGICYGFTGKYETGDGVPLQKSGKRYRIQGLTLTGAGWALPLMFLRMGLLFGGIGLCFPIYSWFAGGKAIFLLQDGTATGARFLDMQPTGTRINERPVMKVNFEYQVDGEKYTALTHALNTSRLTDTPHKVVLYDPMQPKRSIVLDGLPSGVQFDELVGRFGVNSSRLVLPLLAATIVCGQIIVIVILAIRAI